MPLSVGDRLGHYEIVAPLGAGGMGEVCRAKDTRLKREVAVKVLPEAFARDSGRMARLQREAEVLAALNHPNIAQIYGAEESALVMELVEGSALGDLIQQGAIPLEETLEIARQIAEALEAAHEKGIIHRDLKPANIKIKPDGTVKVLDFRAGGDSTTCCYRRHRSGRFPNIDDRSNAGWRNHGHGGLYEPGTGRGQAGGPALGHLVVRRGAV
jgi:eukaryotic-like serine/threonine-protein kinase